MIIYVLTYQTNMQTNILCVLCIQLISANKSMLLPTGDWIDNIESLILSYIVNSQTCELERNAKLIGLSGQPSVYTGVHPSRERSAALTPPVGSSGHCLSSAEQKGAASILDKGGIHVGSWRHPC